MAETGPLPQPSDLLILLWERAPRGGEEWAGKGCPTDSSSPSAPPVDAHSQESREDGGVCSTQEFRNQEVMRGPDVQPSRLIPRAAFESELCFRTLHSPSAARRSASPRQRASAKLEVPGGGLTAPRRFPFLPFWGGKITQPCLFPQPRRARSLAYGHFALRICVIRRVFCGWLRVCMCVCMCEAQALGTNVHLLNLTIKSYSGAAKGTGGGGGRQRGWGRAGVSKGYAKAPGPGIMSGEGKGSSCSFSRGVYGSEGACVPVKSTHRSAQHMSPQITVSLPPPTPHSLLTEGETERGAEKRRRFNRCLDAQCTFSRIHCLRRRRR